MRTGSGRWALGVGMWAVLCISVVGQMWPNPGPGQIPRAATVVFDAGFDFRATSTYVTDPAFATYQVVNSGGVPAETYPTTRTVNGAAATFGWESGTTNLGPGRDRSSSVDARLAGVNQVAAAKPGNAVWRLELPAAGAYDVDLAVGDATSSQVENVEIQDGTAAVISFTNVSVSAGAFLDASGVVRSTAANWVANHATRRITFLTTTLRVVLKPPTASSSTIAHLRVTRVP
ncbi:MAG: hypothetical protein ACRD3E_09270 [Terriglobales bacterium]